VILGSFVCLNLREVGSLLIYGKYIIPGLKKHHNYQMPYTFSISRKTPFSDHTLEQVARLKEIYGMDYGVEASHRLREIASQPEEEH